MIGEEVIAVYGDAGDGEELFEVQKLVRCKECKHRPIKEDPNGSNRGFNIIEPNLNDDLCPCLVEDGFYSWLPHDNFYCGYGERKESE